MIYLYAITESGGRAPDQLGLADQPLSLLELGGLYAVYSTHETLDLRPAPEALWAHDQVVEHAMRSGATLPVRFGTTFASLDAMATTLEPELPALRERLDQVRDCVELAVRVAIPPAPAEASGSGRDYIDSRLEQNRRRRDIVSRALSPLEQLSVRMRELRRAPAEVISASFLVRARDVESFTAEVRSLQQRGEGSMSCTGPWPPYSFSDIEERV